MRLLMSFDTQHNINQIQNIGMVSFERYKLKNGLTVLLHHDKTTPMVVVNTLYDVGAGTKMKIKQDLPIFLNTSCLVAL